MKKLISLNNIKDCVSGGGKRLYIDGDTIITPSARDAAKEYGIEFVEACTMAENASESRAEDTVAKACSRVADECKGVDTELIYRLVREVLKELPLQGKEVPFERECDSGGLRLVRGGTVKYEKFDAAAGKADIALRDITDLRESPNMCAGFMTINNSTFEWELKYEEFEYIIEGCLDITVNGRTYRGRKGDVFYIPKGSRIVWHTPESAKLFYTTYPANWSDFAK